MLARSLRGRFLGLGFAVGPCAAFAALLAPSVARASNVTEFPDNGSEQLGRGGAWIARASDPLATVFNPAGLAGQPTRITVQTNLNFEHTCFTRVKAAGDMSDDPFLPFRAQGSFPRVCNDVKPTLNPQIGVALRVNDRLGLGLLLIAPSSGGEKTFPDFVNDGAGKPQPAPSRYLMVQQAGVILFPTIGIGYELFDNLRLGASFSWGVAHLKLTNAAYALNTDQAQPGNDVRAKLQVADYFVPGFTVGALWSATPEIDVAGWYKWSDAIRARGDVGTAANFYNRDNAAGNDKDVTYGDTIYEDCGTGRPVTACAGGGNATVKFVIPMEAKLGVRYHKPRSLRTKYDAAPGSAAEEAEHRAAVRAIQRNRDPLATDVFDIEANLTWANNSAAQNVEIRFPGDETGKGKLPVAGAGAELPPNADLRRDFKDVIGFRLGGDYNVVPDKLALRAGGFIESSAANPAFQNIDFAAAMRFGFALGGTYRIRFGEGDKTSALEIMAGYGHVFYADQSLTDPNAVGSPALAGTSCNTAAVADVSTCADGNPRYRSKWPVNLGTITNSMNVINLGLAYRF